MLGRNLVSGIVAVLLAGAGLVGGAGAVHATVSPIVEYPIPTVASGAHDIAPGPDGNLWFTEYSASKIGKSTISGAITEYSVPTANSNPAGIVAGPDGNLWVTEFNFNKIAKVTTSGSFKEYIVPTPGGKPNAITVGPDGNLWFTEHDSNKVGKVTTAGTFTEYPIPTPISFPGGIVAGPDGNLWFTESNVNKIGKVTTGGVFTEYSIPTPNSAPEGIDAGPDGNIWFTEFATNKIGNVTTSGTFTEYTIPTASSAPSRLAHGSDGNMWFTEYAAGQVGEVTTSGVFTEYAIPSTSSEPIGITPDVYGNMWFTESAGNKLGKFVVPTCGNTISRPATATASSNSQYTLHSSDGTTWQTMDAANLTLTCTPGASQSTLLTANSDLWTANAGYNQDLGIFVSDNGGVDQLLAWKESGGSAGTFSPNAAFVQVVFNMTAGHTYVFTLKWKTNQNAPGVTIYAGAGSGPYSPTTLMSETFPVGQSVQFASPTAQSSLTGSDGTTWQALSTATISFSPVASDTVMLGANADLWTAKAGYNQDLAIFVSDNGGPNTLVAWKESGGFAGTFSPNAAFVKATFAMAGGHTYVFTLRWKANHSAVGATIYAGAGNGPAYSPTSLLGYEISAGANPYSATSTVQYHLSNSNGSTWQTIDAVNLTVTVPATANTNSVLGGNVDLWTANAGYNQDIAIFVSDNGGSDVLLAWKESGGFAGTFSPNAAFVQAVFPMIATHTYVFKLKWKTNGNAPGSTIYAGAGPIGGLYSPTRLTVELTN